MKGKLLIIFLLLFASFAEAKSLYVNNSGSPACSDSTPYANNSASNPWCTILRAVRGNSDGNRNTAGVSAQAAQAGDTVFITAGIYNYTGASYNQGGFGGPPLYESINSGTSGSWITYQAVGGVAEIPGNTGGSAQQIGSFSANYVKFNGFKVVQADIGFRAGGAVVSIWTNNVWLENFEVVGQYTSYGGDDNHVGIMTHGPRDGACTGAITGITIRNSKIHGVTGDNGNNDAGITIYCTGQITIENNEIYGNGHGIHGKSSYTDNSTPSYIRKNLIYSNQKSGISLQAFNNYRIYQNIFRDNGQSVLRLHASREGVSPTEIQPNNIYFVNNTADGNSNGIYLLGSTNCGDFTSNYVRNNIMTSMTTGMVSQDVECTTVANVGRDSIDFNYNVFEHSGAFWDTGSNTTLATFKSTYRQGANQWNNIDPLYVDKAGHNFKLQDSSPCREGQTNAGIDILDLDNDGQTNDPITIGAYITGNEVIGVWQIGGVLSPPTGVKIFQ